MTGTTQNFSYDAAGSLKQVADASNTLFGASYLYSVKPLQTAITDMGSGQLELRRQHTG